MYLAYFPFFSRRFQGWVEWWILAIPRSMSNPTFIFFRKASFENENIKLFPVSHYFACDNTTFLLYILLERLLKVDHTDHYHFLLCFAFSRLLLPLLSYLGYVISVNKTIREFVLCFVCVMWLINQLLGVALPGQSVSLATPKPI
jgi:hypothetical protein